jgi:hypothetical protein
MKACFKSATKYFNEDQIQTLKDLIGLLQKELPLRKDIHVNFVNKDDVKTMTTGVRFKGGKICVMAEKRLLIDIIRTLAHEWVHEFQHQQLGLKEKQRTQNIGGPVENMANVLAGIMTKKFEKLFPKHQKTIYGED